MKTPHNSECARALQATTASVLSFRDRYLQSPQFAELYREGMDLVDRTADYIDGAGRREAKALTPPASQVYTLESIKLTTRLTQLASWLLVKRAVAAGEITASEAAKHRHRVKLTPQSSVRPKGFETLPPGFMALISESHRLYDRLIRLERLMTASLDAAPEAPSPVDHERYKLRLAFPAA